MDKIRINYTQFDLKNGDKGVIVVLMYSGNGDPKIALDNAVSKLTNGIEYFELIDAHLDNPWTRVIMTNINDMNQFDLDFEKHQLNKLKKINNE